MRRLPLWYALAASAAVHLALLAGLLALAHPVASMAPRLRVSLLGASPEGGGGQALRSPGAAEPGAAADEGGAGAAASTPAPNAHRHERPGRGRGEERTGRPESPPPEVAHSASTAAEPVHPVPPAPEPARRRQAARRPDLSNSVEPGVGDASGAGPVAALLTPVQSDLWVLPRSGPSAATGSHPPGSGNAQGPLAGNQGPQGGSSRQGGGASAGAGTPSGPAQGSSLLAELSERLAWSARRCAPPSSVRLTRRPVPVPLRFCLDGAGRPSEVGLLGTTGSDQLDRAARDCVVPGAAPLPPAPGCYTVEVRFPSG